MSKIKLELAMYCEDCKERYRGKHVCSKYLIVNGKKFKYECSCKEHNATCLTQAMVDELSVLIYAEDAE